MSAPGRCVDTLLQSAERGLRFLWQHNEAMATENTGMPAIETVAYFSMEIGLEEAIPTYAGGLGVLAGDTVRSAADMGVPLVAVSLVHRKGYFRQRLDARGNQTEEPVGWTMAEHLAELAPRVAVEIEHRRVQLRAWRFSTPSGWSINTSARPISNDDDG